MHKVFFTEQAAESIGKITDYIAYELRNPQAANALIDKIEKTADEIAVFPYGFKIYIKLHDEEFRAVYVDNYVMFFHIQDDSVIIDSLKYASRDKRNLIAKL